MRLKDKVAIVTGGGRGIGRAIAMDLAKEGCNIVIAARTLAEIQKTAKDVKKYGVETLAIRTDLEKYSDIRNLVKKTLERFDRIDFLINNAGVLVSKSLLETKEEEWDYVLDINLKAMFLASKEVLPTMIKQKSGVIVNISSGAGKYGYANMSAYCASKFGVIGLTESLAKEVNMWGIRVYAVCPGAVNTRMQDDSEPASIAAKLLMLQPEDISKNVLELCLPDCKNKTGSSVEVYFKFYKTLKKFHQKLE